MPIDNRPFPRFVADASRHGIPHGRFAERLATAFRAACEEIEDLPEGTRVPDELTWFPERSWSGRVWVPVSGDGEAILSRNERHGRGDRLAAHFAGLREGALGDLPQGDAAFGPAER